MDFSKFKTSDWLKIGGTVVFFISAFLGWVKASFSGFGGETGNAFEFFWTGTLPWLILIASGIITLLAVNGNVVDNGKRWPLIVLLGNLLATVLVLIRLIFNPLEGKSLAEASGFDFSPAVGLWIGSIAAVASLVGAFMAFTESGGNLKDLTDVNKLKDSFGSSGDSTPPPPPPSA